MPVTKLSKEFHNTTRRIFERIKNDSLSENTVVPKNPKTTTESTATNIEKPNLFNNTFKNAPVYMPSKTKEEIPNSNKTKNVVEKPISNSHRKEYTPEKYLEDNSLILKNAETDAKTKDVTAAEFFKNLSNKSEKKENKERNIPVPKKEIHLNVPLPPKKLQVPRNLKRNKQGQTVENKQEKITRNSDSYNSQTQVALERKKTKTDFDVVEQKRNSYVEKNIVPERKEKTNSKELMLLSKNESKNTSIVKIKPQVNTIEKSETFVEENAIDNLPMFSINKNENKTNVTKPTEGYKKQETKLMVPESLPFFENKRRILEKKLSEKRKDAPVFLPSLSAEIRKLKIKKRNKIEEKKNKVVKKKKEKKIEDSDEYIENIGKKIERIIGDKNKTKLEAPRKLPPIIEPSKKERQITKKGIVKENKQKKDTETSKEKSVETNQQDVMEKFYGKKLEQEKNIAPKTEVMKKEQEKIEQIKPSKTIENMKSKEKIEDFVAHLHNFSSDTNTKIKKLIQNKKIKRKTKNREKERTISNIKSEEKVKEFISTLHGYSHNFSENMTGLIRKKSNKTNKENQNNLEEKNKLQTESMKTNIPKREKEIERGIGTKLYGHEEIVTKKNKKFSNAPRRIFVPKKKRNYKKHIIHNEDNIKLPEKKPENKELQIKHNLSKKREKTFSNFEEKLKTETKGVSEYTNKPVKPFKSFADFEEKLKLEKNETPSDTNKSLGIDKNNLNKKANEDILSPETLPNFNLQKNNVEMLNPKQIEKLEKPFKLDETNSEEIDLPPLTLPSEFKSIKNMNEFSGLTNNEFDRKEENIYNQFNDFQNRYQQGFQYGVNNFNNIDQNIWKNNSLEDTEGRTVDLKSRPEGPLYIRTDSYRKILSNLSSMNNSINNGNDIVYSLRNLKKNIDIDHEEYKEVLEDIQKKLIYIDKILFRR